MHEPPVFLIGMPGSGKTTLGRALAKHTGQNFIDLDLYIQGRFHCSVSDLFARRGEDGFRRIEHNMLHEVGEMEDVIVACGGGTPCFFDNMDYMLSRGTVVHLKADRKRLHERLCRYRDKRPAIADKTDDQIADYIDKILAQREPAYNRAPLCLESSLLEDKRQIASTVQACLDMLHSDISKNNIL